MPLTPALCLVIVFTVLGVPAGMSQDISPVRGGWLQPGTTTSLDVPSNGSSHLVLQGPPNDLVWIGIGPEFSAVRSWHLVGASTILPLEQPGHLGCSVSIFVPDGAEPVPWFQPGAPSGHAAVLIQPGVGVSTQTVPMGMRPGPTGWVPSAAFKNAPGSSNGSYGGPGDTVPPITGSPPDPGNPCTPSPNCGGAFPPPASVPCGINISFGPLYNGSTWTPAASTGCVMPPCMMYNPAQFTPLHVVDVNIFQLLYACQTAAYFNSPFAKLCITNPCFYPPGGGVARVFVYETIPFQTWPGGIPLPNGNVVPVCGLDFEVLGVGSGSNCWDLNTCGVGPFAPQPITITFACECLEQILAYYQSVGLYNPFGGPSVYLSPQSVVFSVAIACQNGTLCCGFD